MPAKDQTFDLQQGPRSQKTKTVPDKSSQTIYQPSQLHSSLLHGKALIGCQGAIWQTGYHGMQAQRVCSVTWRKITFQQVTLMTSVTLSLSPGLS